jgi:hypothetical protein
MTWVNRTHVRLTFRNSEGKEASAVVADSDVQHPLTACRVLREQHGIPYRPPGGLVDRHKWHELLRAAMDASFADGDGPMTLTAPAESDYRGIVSRTYGALQGLLNSGSADSDEIRAALAEGVAALDVLDARAGKRPGPAG